MISIKEKPSIKSIGDTSLFVDFQYNPEVISILKQAGNAIWNKKEKIWELPNNSLSFLIDKLTYLDDIEIELLEENKDSEVLGLTIDYKTKPFEHQLEGIRYMINNPNCLILDEPGLGKTLITIYSALELKKQKGIEHCLIICGINSLKTNWKKEIEKHSDETSVIIGQKITSRGTVKYTSVKERAEQLYKKIDEFFIILNVESLRDNIVVDAIKNSENKFDMIVLDECHKIKDVSSQQGKSLLKLRTVGERHIGLTGTLLVNSPLDAYAPLKFIGKEKANLTNFKSFYCNFEMKFGHPQIIGFKNMDLLKDEISECSIRRCKDLLNLPEKVIIPEYIEMDAEQASFYEDIHNGVLEEADRIEIKTTSLLGLVIRERQASTCPQMLTTNNIESCKIDRVLSLVEEITSLGEKVVIFSTFKEPLYKLNDLLQKYNPLLGTGDLTDQVVSDNIDKFQNNDSYRVFLGTSQKMSTGLTLTAASYMIILDSPWTYSDFTQMCDRIHRIGASKTVMIYDLIAKDTIDERIFNIINRKRGISEYMIDDTNPNEELREILGLGGSKLF